MLLIGAAAIGVVIGFVVGGVVVSPSADTTSPTTVAATAVPPDTIPLEVPVFAEGRESPPRPTVPSEVPLRELVPGLDGRLLVASLADEELWNWPADEREPRRTPLPGGTIYAGWDASGGRVAALAFSRVGNTLYLFDGDFRPAVIGVDDFVWHQRRAGRLAWTATRADGTIGLYRGDVTSTGISEELVTELDFAPGPDGGLMAFGDWGFAIDVRRFDSDFHTVTLAPDGSRIGTSPLYLVTAADDGTLLLAEEFQVVGNPYVLSTSDPAFASSARFPYPIERRAVWSSEGSTLATVQTSNLGASLLVIDEFDSFRYLTGLADAVVIGWAPDDSFVVLYTDRGENADRPQPALVFIDVIDRSIHQVPVGGPANARIVDP